MLLHSLEHACVCTLYNNTLPICTRIVVWNLIIENRFEGEKNIEFLARQQLISEVYVKPQTPKTLNSIIIQFAFHGTCNCLVIFFRWIKPSEMDSTNDEFFLALRQFWRKQKTDFTFVEIRWCLRTHFNTNTCTCFPFLRTKIKWSNTFYGTESSNVFNGINLLHKIAKAQFIYLALA